MKVIFFNIPAHGHINPALPVVGDQAALMDEIGGGTLAQNALMLTHVSERLIPWVFDLLDRERPDYVITDSLALWAKQASEQRGIRAATRMSTFVVSRDVLPPFTPRMILDLVAQMLPISAPPYLNTPGRCLAFVVEGYNLENSDELAAFFDAVRKCLTKKCQ